MAAGSSEKTPVSCAGDAMQVHSATGGPKSSRAVLRSGNLNDPRGSQCRLNAKNSPISSKPGSRTVESEGDPVSLRDIEMILAPGISPPPLPTLARAPSKLPAPRRPVEPPAAEAPKAAPRWTAEAAPCVAGRSARPPPRRTPHSKGCGSRPRPTSRRPPRTRRRGRRQTQRCAARARDHEPGASPRAARPARQGPRHHGAFGRHRRHPRGRDGRPPPGSSTCAR
jgi:hypothetical protein